MAVETLGGLDILINNPAVVMTGPQCRRRRELELGTWSITATLILLGHTETEVNPTDGEGAGFRCVLP